MTALAVAAVLLVFNARRLVFLAAAAVDLVRRRPDPAGFAGDEALPLVLALAPMRNEAGNLPDLVDALLALDYPAERLTIGLIDDASTDETGAAMDALAAGNARLDVLHNLSRLGKADSLNAGLVHWPEGRIVVVYDADARPQPGSLRRIVDAFADPDVAAAGGLIRPANGLASLTATYAAVERLVHQQITMRAKDRLDLAPAILGSNCAYRRSDLEAVGGFPGGAFLEDSHLTVALAQAGRRTRFLPDAVARDSVPETLAGYWRQHVRWGRGFVDVATGETTPLAGGRRLKPASEMEKHAEASWRRAVSGGGRRVELALFGGRRLKPASEMEKHAEASWRRAVSGGGRRVELALFGGRRLKPASEMEKHAEASWQRAVSGGGRRVELALFSLGYLDRLALLAGVGLLALMRPARVSGGAGKALAAMVLANVLLPYGQIAAALAVERAPLAWWLRLPAMPAFFAVDAVAALWSALLSLAGRPRVWQPTERASSKPAAS